MNAFSSKEGGQTDVASSGLPFDKRNEALKLGVRAAMLATELDGGSTKYAALPEPAPWVFAGPLIQSLIN
jgi:hypothetical protein